MRIHFVGIGGSGMGSLAGLLKRAGHEVRGSDQKVYPPMSGQLAAAEIGVVEGFRAENLDWGPERVVVGNVCRHDHVEVVEAQRRGIPLASFPSLLSELFLVERRGIVVAGTHGKTTTSALLAHILCDAGRDASYLIGGVPLNTLASFRLGAGQDFVVEGDEYDTAFFDKGSKFLHYRPKAAILTSVEYDHADIFANEESVRGAFRRFVELIPPEGALVVCAGSPGAVEVARAARCRTITYGRPGTGAEWTFEVASRSSAGRTTLRLGHDADSTLLVETLLPGTHNFENLLGASVLALHLGVATDAVARALRSFLGVRRRQEVRGVAAGVTVVEDFAHHPTAIRLTLSALAGRHGPGRLLAAFEPRSATSRRSVFQGDFADSLALADEVVLAPLFAPERIPVDQRLDLEKLVADLRSRDVPARVIDSPAETAVHLAERATSGDTVAIMTSGDYGGLPDLLLERLGDPVVPAASDDAPAISRLLDRAGVVHEDPSRFWPTMLVVRGANSNVVGCIATEALGEVGLLRWLAVVPERRGEGLGYLLVDVATTRARALGIKRLYLVADGAEGFFGQKFGFQPIDRRECDAAITTTGEFQMARSKTGTWMRKVL